MTWLKQLYGVGNQYLNKTFYTDATMKGKTAIYQKYTNARKIDLIFRFYRVTSIDLNRSDCRTIYSELMANAKIYENLREMYTWAQFIVILLSNNYCHCMDENDRKCIYIWQLCGWSLYVDDIEYSVKLAQLGRFFSSPSSSSTVPNFSMRMVSFPLKVLFLPIH